eukprot:10321677-Alexandrium_andersonii.AAC.1
MGACDCSLPWRGGRCAAIASTRACLCGAGGGIGGLGMQAVNWGLALTNTSRLCLLALDALATR